MHYYLIPLFIISSLTLVDGQPPEQEKPFHLNVYVWEFATQHAEGDAKKIANLLTNDFETELTQSGFYEVLEIRERSRLDEQRALQQLIFNVDELSEEERHQLEDKRAEAVFFGKLIYNEQSKENILEVKLQHMDGRLLRKGSIYLNPSDLIMNETRRSKVNELFTEVHQDIFEAQQQALEKARTAQYEIVAEKLNQYMRRAEDLTTQFRRLDLSLLSEQYMEEYTQSIYRYDEVIQDLLEKHTAYESDFKARWDADLSDQLTRIFEQVMDFHHRYIFKSLNKRNEQITRFAKTHNKRERQKLEADLKEEKKSFEETMNDQWPVIRSDIEQFMYRLRRQLN